MGVSLPSFTLRHWLCFRSVPSATLAVTHNSLKMLCSLSPLEISRDGGNCPAERFRWSKMQTLLVTVVWRRKTKVVLHNNNLLERNEISDLWTVWIGRARMRVHTDLVLSHTLFHWKCLHLLILQYMEKLSDLQIFWRIPEVTRKIHRGRKIYL